MNWKLILQLSLFGLGMGVATVYAISSDIEPIFWLVIFAICAWFIATQAGGRYFQHGLLLGIANSVWVTAAHVLLFNQYIARHEREAAMMATMPLPDSPRLMMAIVGPLIGVVSGIVIGLFSLAAARFVRGRTSPPVAG